MIINCTVDEFRQLLSNPGQQNLVSLVESFEMRIDHMSTVVQELVSKLEQENSIQAGITLAITELTGVVGSTVQVMNNTITTMQGLKTTLDQVLANGGLTEEDRATLQAASEKAAADVAAGEEDVAKINAAVAALSGASNDVALAIEVNTASN